MCYNMSGDNMIYNNTVFGSFVKRLNRFTAKVLIDGNIETVHVKNTARLGELLLEGAEVCLQISDNPNRKTKYDLISVVKPNLGWVNIDSQVSNIIVHDYLKDSNYINIKPEFTYGKSRIDFYAEKNGEKYLIEVKGCTLEFDNVGYFPDAPSIRAVKHLNELTHALEEGYRSMVIFVSAMNGVTEVCPYEKNDPDFAEAFHMAEKAGVVIKTLPCKIGFNSIKYISKTE
ncbi:MAG: DNA/RNA nuclease SfsA [Clostridia bacterium]|nr:DNA/RNA nuclease SfsA [Clostridia bacterium]